MPQSYPFPIFSGLLEPKHYNRIGNAVWLFLWCISSTTKDVEKDGVTWGIVLGNKPVKLTDLSERFGVTERTIRSWIKDLEKYEYIRVTRAPYGLIFTVKNSKKYKIRPEENFLSDPERKKTSDPDRKETSDHPEENFRSNKDITKILNDVVDVSDPSSKISDDSKSDLMIQVLDAFCEIHTKSDRNVTQRERALMNQMIAGGVPSPFIIQVMHEVFVERKAGGEDISSFLYYEKPIYKAWKNQQPITDKPAPTVAVPLGVVRKSNLQLRNEEAKRKIKEAEERERERSEEAFPSHPEHIQRL